MRIYDCIMYLDEDLLLNIRFNILNDIVNIIDKFRIKPIIEFEVNYHMGPITKEMAQSILDKFVSFGYKKLKLDESFEESTLGEILLKPTEIYTMPI